MLAVLVALMFAVVVLVVGLLIFRSSSVYPSCPTGLTRNSVNPPPVATVLFVVVVVAVAVVEVLVILAVVVWAVVVEVEGVLVLVVLMVPPFFFFLFPLLVFPGRCTSSSLPPPPLTDGLPLPELSPRVKRVRRWSATCSPSFEAYPGASGGCGWTPESPPPPR